VFIRRFNLDLSVIVFTGRLTWEQYSVVRRTTYMTVRILPLVTQCLLSADFAHEYVIRGAINGTLDDVRFVSSILFGVYLRYVLC